MKKCIVIFLFFSCKLFAAVHSLKTIDSLKILVAVSNDTSRIRLVNKIAISFLTDNRFDSAASYAKEACALQNKYRYPKEYIISYDILTSAFMGKHDYDSSLIYANKELDIANALGDFDRQYTLYKRMAFCYDKKSKSELALSYLLKGLSLAEIKKDSIKLGDTYNTIGTLYLDHGNSDLALSSYRKSLGIILPRKFKELSPEYAILTNTYTNLGALMNRKYSGDQQTKAYLDSAIIYYNRGIEAARKSKDGELLTCYLLFNASDAYNKKGDYTKAIDVLMESETILPRLQDVAIPQIAIYINLGDAYTGLNNMEVAVQYLEKGIALAKKINNNGILTEAYLSLSKTYEKANRFDQALCYYRIYSTRRDSAMKIGNTFELSEMNSKYQKDKNETEIQLLRKDDQLLQHQVDRQKAIRNVVFGGLFLVVILSFLLLGRYRITKQLNKDLDRSNLLVNNRNNLILDSISYAERIQRSILPPTEALLTDLTDSFVVFFPRNIIGGDLYWFSKMKNKIVLSAVDCTGLGVPGALMSMVAYNLLNRSAKVENLPDAAAVVNSMNKGLYNFVAQTVEKTKIRDGMDLSVCLIDLDTLMMSFSGAQNSVYVVRNNMLTELKSERISIGDPVYLDHIFSSKSIQLQKGDWVYLFTDGFVDQKGGPQNKKFYFQPFQELIKEIHVLPGAVQKERLEKTFHEWKGDAEQIDDVLIFGIKI